MAKRMVHLIFPPKLIKKPIIYQTAKKYALIPNIRRANVTDKIGEVVLELSGETKNLEKGIAYLTKIGVRVEPVVGDIIE